MKSQRRHELQGHVLADWLSQKISWAQSNSTWLLGGILVLLAVVILLTIRESRLSTAVAEGWNRIDQASGSGFNAIARNEPVALNNASFELEDVARAHEGTVLAGYAQLTLGDLSLISGQRKYRSNKTAAQDSFRKAGQYYKTVAEETSESGLKNRALYCLAKSLEWRMKLQQAKAVYAQVQGAFAADAQMRIRDLEQKGTPAFYEQYARWKPREKPAGGTDRYPEFDLKLQGDSPPAEAKDASALQDAIEGAGLEDAAGAVSSGGVAAEPPATGKKTGDKKESQAAKTVTPSDGSSGGKTPAGNPSTPQP